MNSAAYLSKQGWRGQGFPLDHSGRGLANPVLVHHKADRTGLGNKTHDYSEQWWLTALDNKLRNFGGKQSTTISTSENAPKQSKLYARFVKAETLASSISTPNSDMGKKSTQNGADSADINVTRIATDLTLGGVETMAITDLKFSNIKQRKHDAEDTEGVVSEQKAKKAKAEVEVEGTQEKKKKRKPAAKEIRAERKAARAEKSRENARRNRAREREEAIANPPPEPIAISKPTEPVHPESIAALMERGVPINIPAPWLQNNLANVNPARAQLINALGSEQDPQANIEAVQPPTKKKSYKAEKYEREKAKRVAKREVKHWEDVRARPHLYRPDGTLITLQERGVPKEEIKAARQARKGERAQVAAEKEARRKLKDQIKIERRVARKLKRAEKKRNNHMMMQAHISAKLKKQKRERDEAQAAEQGITIEVFLERREQEKAEKRLARDTEKARELGLTLEVYLENRKLAQAISDSGNKQSTNLPANVSDEGIDSDAEQGAKDGTYEHFGKSAIDRIWARDQAERAKRGNLAHNGISESFKASSTDLKPINAPTSTAIIGAGADFIPLNADELSGTPVPFVVDTTGAPSKANDPDAPKRVKDMTKAERKARLEAIRARRAERAALATGVTKKNKEQRRKIRGAKKEALIQQMTSDILARKRGKLHTAAESSVAGGERAKMINLAAEPLVERKQARREARRIMRGMKKGTIPESEIMPGWEKRGFESKGRRKQMKGNGGREPKRVYEPKPKTVMFWGSGSSQMAG